MCIWIANATVGWVEKRQHKKKIENKYLFEIKFQMMHLSIITIKTTKLIVLWKKLMVIWMATSNCRVITCKSLIKKKKLIKMKHPRWKSANWIYMFLNHTKKTLSDDSGI